MTMIINAGANAKEAQELARHSNPDITMNTYAKTRNDQLATLVNKVSTVLPQKKCAVCVPNEENGGDGQPAISSSDNDLDGVLKWWRRRDSKPLLYNNLDSTEVIQNYDNSSTEHCKTEHLQDSGILQEKPKDADVEHFSYTSMHNLRVHSVHCQKTPLDLRLVIEAWESLSRETRLEIARVVLEDVT